MLRYGAALGHARVGLARGVARPVVRSARVYRTSSGCGTTRATAASERCTRFEHPRAPRLYDNACARRTRRALARRGMRIASRQRQCDARLRAPRRSPGRAGAAGSAARSCHADARARDDDRQNPGGSRESVGGGRPAHPERRRRSQPRVARAGSERSRVARSPAGTTSRRFTTAPRLRQPRERKDRAPRVRSRRPPLQG